MSLMLTDCSLLTTLNIPAEFCVKFVLPCRTCPSKSDHVTFGSGNQLRASATRAPLESLNVGTEKAKTMKVVSKNQIHATGQLQPVVTLCD